MTKEEVLNCVHSDSMITPIEASLIYDELIKLPEEGNMLDIGTGHGHSCVMFSKTKPQWIIYTVDIYDKYFECGRGEELVLNDLKATTAYLEYWEVKNVVKIIGNSVTMPWEIRLNALFIDGDHSYEFVKKDFNKFSKFVKKGGVIIFHDANIDGIRKLLDEIGAVIYKEVPTLGVYYKK